MRGRIIAIFGLAALTLAALATAQPGVRGDEQRRLLDAKRASAAAGARAERLARAAEQERGAAAKARAEEAALVARIDAAEADIAAAEARAAIARDALDRQRARLAERQGPVAHLLAALQSMARRPAIVGIAQPGSVDDMVHVRAVLGSVLPVMRTRTAAIRRDLAETRTLEGDAARALAGLTAARARLDDRRLALARLETTHRTRAKALGRTALAESDRAIALGERARELVDLMEQSHDADATRAALAALPAPEPRPLRPGEAAPFDTAHWAGDPPYMLPVSGDLVTGFGEVSRAGVRARGLTLATAGSARAIAPAGGTIAYARAFRGYGRIVIIDHGGGWTTLITGLAELSVKRGDRVAQGDVLGRVGTPDDALPHITVELRRKGRPVDMTPLLG